MPESAGDCVVTQSPTQVIIGGTSGMGLATAKMLLDGGARVLVTGRSQEDRQSAQQELGDGAIVVSSNARSLTDIDALAAQVKTECDTIDLLFVDAGFSIPTPLGSVTEAIYDEMFNLNGKGPFFAVQEFASLINRGGSVVLTTSVANVKGLPGQATYGAAKAALRSLARTLAVELLPREIRVNAETPGPIDTPILHGYIVKLNDPAAMREAACPGLGVTLISLFEVLSDPERGDLIRLLPDWYVDVGNFALLRGPEAAFGQDPCLRRVCRQCVQWQAV